MIVKIVNTSAYPTPKYATGLSAGMDLNANIDKPVIIKSLERAIISTGLFIELPQGYEAQIRPRSGLAAKNGITVANAPGTIDADYRGEIKVILINLSKETFTVKPGERIAQMVIAKYQQIQWSVVDHLTETLRGDSGFGSTGLGAKAATVSVAKISNGQGKPDIFKLYVLYKKTTGFCTDTRQITKGCMFFALKGETFNGNEFVLKALDKGAAYAVSDDEKLVKEARKKYPKKIILVDDVLRTLQMLARHHRLQFKIPVIGLTGTNGKTTTKELITATLATRYKVVSTTGNYNNDIGVPVTLLKINKSTQVAVVEMGANHPHDIGTLVNVVCPTFGLITSVGKAHLLGFGSFEGVKKAKGELYDNLQEYKKIAFVNVDNPILKEMAEQRPNMQIVPYGLKSNCAKILMNKEDDPFLKMEMPDLSGSSKNGKMIKITTHLIGDYNSDNVLAALCVATYFAVPTSAAVKAIGSYMPSNNRSQMTKTKLNTLIKDTYNANPTSMQASLQNFDSLAFKNKALLLGDMLELGADSVKEHKIVVEQALKMKPKKVIFIGDEFGKAYKQLYEKRADCIKNVSGIGSKNAGIKSLAGKTIVELYKTSAEYAEQLKRQPLKGCSILIKGSHGIKLETLFDLL
ncbi:MAG TPA: dUTP diphosphatase [Candidatus Egerieousia sp.]|nr:dUTP diphosphatase [Candidatus Egerieousia sp.]HPT05865.1 dUTP diphosphatase [Candidatus Egerieousia sp.]